MSKLILISSFYSYNTFKNFFDANLGGKPDKIYFFVDFEKDSTQSYAINKVKQEWNKDLIDYEFIECEIDPVNNCKKCLQIIKTHINDRIIIDISSGLKTRCFGMNYAAFNNKNIELIGYYNQKTGKIDRMPNLKIKLTKNQKEVLEHSRNPEKTHPLSHSSFYYQRKILTEYGFILNKKLTQAGEIVLIITK
ncbi:MAG: DUF6293 family protein [Candidatus Micrarchaeia archaeon]|jgi:hypothetical protein